MKGLHKDSIQDVGNPHQWMIEDAKMLLLQQIRAEIERLNSLVPYGRNDRHDDGLHDAYKAIFSLLDTLQEKSEKPINPTLQEQPVCEELEEEVKRMYAKDNVTMRTLEQYTQLARHFVQWQKEKDEEVINAVGDIPGDIEKAYHNGRKDMREQMMKEAVEGVICGDNAKLWVCNNPPSFILDKFKDGDKVKLIFIKEN